MTKQKLPKLMLICITLFTLHMIYAAEKPITLVYAIGIRDGAKGTDGVTFKVEVSENGKKYNLLGTTHYKESAWKFLTADLSKYRDNKITIRLSIDPGESTACDWAGWGDIAIAEGEVPKNFQGDFKNSSFKTIVKLDTIGFTKGIVTKNGEIPTFDADSGGIFNVDYIKCAGVLKHGFFSHPCWKEEYKGSGVFAEFKINNLSFLDTGGVETHSDNKEFSKSAFSEKKNYAYPPEIAAWNTETKNEQIKKAEKFLKDFNAATTRKDKKFIIQPGDYRFDDELKQQLVFSNAVNMEIIADGVTFWIEESGGIKFVHCFNVSVKGLTIDYDPLPFTQAVIVDINQTEQCLIVRIIDGFPSPEKYPSSQKPCFTPDGKFIPDFFSDKIQSYESVGDKTIRIKFLRGALFKEPTKSLDGTRVKDIIVINPRRGNTIRSVSCGRMTFEDITLYASSGFGFAEGADAGVNAGGNVYRKCKIVRRPGTKRFIGCNADAFHSIEAVKGPLIEDCEFSWSCDDFVNIHGFFAMVYAAQDSTHLKIANLFHPNFSTNSLLCFNNFDSLESEGKAKVVSFEAVEDQNEINDALKNMPIEKHTRDFPIGLLWNVTLDQPVKAEKYSLVSSDGGRGRGFIIRNNYFHDNTTRGILANGEDGLVENNRIERTGTSGILISPDLYWLEGPVPNNIIVRSNTFSDCMNLLLWRGSKVSTVATINIVAGTGLESSKKIHPIPLIYGITIEGNRIIRSGIAGIFVGNAFDVTIKYNLIEDPVFYPPLLGNGRDFLGEEANYGIYLASARNVDITHNTIIINNTHCQGKIKLGGKVENKTVRIKE